MAHITADRVKQTSTSIGTGSIVLSGSIASFRDFSAVLAVNDTFWYAIASYPGSEWEVGLGTYTSASTFTRTTVLSSSNAGAAVTFSAGTKEVFITAAASKFLQADAAGNYGIGISIPTQKLDVVGTGKFNSMEIGANNSDINNANANAIAFKIQGTERMRIDTSGNLGLGVVPSVWQSSVKALQFGTNAAVVANNSFWTGANFYFDSAGTTTYITTDFATGHQQFDGQHRFYTAPSGTAGAAITFTQAMTLDASGNLGVGTTGSLARIAVENSAAGDGVIIRSNGFNTNKAGASNSLLLGSDYTSGISYVVAGGSSTNTTLVFFTAASAAPVERLRIDSSGNVVIGATSTTYKLQVVGSFAATTKSFVIDHPTKEGKKLRYGSLEGPENGVYVRGKLSNNDTIELPEYWTKLVDEDSITVNLTPIGKHQKLYVKSIEDNKVIIGNENLLGSINCFYTIFAERIDVSKLEVEID